LGVFKIFFFTLPIRGLFLCLPHRNMPEYHMVCEACDFMHA
jgi:hypothetical protein